MAERCFSAVMFEYHRARSAFEGALVEIGFEQYAAIRGDDYDGSIEFDEVAPSARLDDTAQRLIFDAGFLRAFLNHTDGWETHYSWRAGPVDATPFRPDHGWRRKELQEPQRFLISHWPKSWGDPETGPCAQWLRSGYMTVVPEEEPR